MYTASRRSLHFEKNEVSPLSGHGTPWRSGDRGGEFTPPAPKKTYLKTGGDLEQMHRIETTVKGRSDTGHQGQHLLSSKDECTLSERELSRGINSSRDATAKEASENGCEGPVPQAMRGDRGPPVKLRLERKLSTTDMKVTTHDRDGTPCRPDTEARCSLRGHNAQILLGDHKPAGVTRGGQRLDGLLGFPPQGGKKEPIIQTAEKAYLRRVCPPRHHCEDPGKGLESSQQTKKHEGRNV